MNPTARTLFLALPAGLFALLCYYTISQFHVSPLSRDQWHMYAPYFDQGLWHTVLTPMSNHRHILPFFIFHIDMEYFHGNNHFLVFFGALFNVLIIGTMMRITLKASGLSATEKTLLCTFYVFILTWLITIAQLGWGFMSTMYYSSIYCYLLSLAFAWYYFVNHGPVKWLALSIALGVITTFTFGIGILVWPAMAVLLLLWKVPAANLLKVIAAMVFCLLVFFSLPGGNSIQSALLFNPFDSIKFVFTLPAGPVYYLLKSLRLLDEESLKLIARTVSFIATGGGIGLLLYTWSRSRASGLLESLFYAFMLLGLGSAALISLTRPPLLLDTWADRYQIWGLMFWLGFLPLLWLHSKKHLSTNHKKAVALFLWLLPLMGMPSQLDQGSRLSEYRTRVTNALTTFQAGIADQTDAEKALHWIWEYKLPFFFYVFSQLEENGKNIYSDGVADYLGQKHEEVFKNFSIQEADIKIQRVTPIERLDLIDVHSHIYNNHDPGKWFYPQGDIAGYRIYGSVSESMNISWDVAVVSDGTTVTGIGRPARHYPLPRGNLKHIGKFYNAFAVSQSENTGVQLYLLDREKGIAYVPAYTKGLEKKLLKLRLAQDNQ